MNSEVKAIAKPTYKQKKFITAMAKGFNAGDAAIKAGYSDKAYGYYLKGLDSIKSILVKEMERAGVNEELIAQKLREGMDALTVPKVPGEDRRFEDHFIRKQFLEMAIKIRGDFAPEKVESVRKEIKLVIDSHLIKALKDSKVIGELGGIEELNVIDVECEEVKEEINGNEMGTGIAFPEGIGGGTEKAEGTGEAIGGRTGEEKEKESGEGATACEEGSI